MKFSIKLFSLLFAFSFFLGSCSKQGDDLEQDQESLCEFEIVIEPICAFNPKTAQSVHFPVRVLRDGVTIANPEYSYTWSSDADFGGSAISISYEELPLTVELIEVATGCTAEATLERSFWD